MNKQDAINLLQNHYLDLAEKGKHEVFGHSFDDNNMQFVITNISNGLVKIQLFSWLDGCESNEKKVTVDFIKNNCLLYLSEHDWGFAGDYIGKMTRKC